MFKYTIFVFSIYLALSFVIKQLKGAYDMFKVLSFLVILAFAGSTFANEALRSPSDLEIKAALVSLLQSSKGLAEQNKNLTREEVKTTSEEVDKLLAKIDSLTEDLVKIKREVEKREGNYILGAIGVGFGGEFTPLKVNMPRVVPAVGAGMELSAGLLTAFIKNTNTNKNDVRFSLFGANGVHLASQPAAGKAFSLARTQVFPTIKLFFASSGTGDYELINFSDLNRRRFYGVGYESSWKIRVPFTQLAILKGTAAIQQYGAWVNNEDLNSNIENAETLERVTTYAKRIGQAAIPDLLMLSINVGFGSDQGGKSSVQLETQKISIFGDSNGSGSTLQDVFQTLTDI